MTEQMQHAFPPRKFFAVAVALFIGVLVLGAIVSGIRAEAAWSQGYAMGLMASGDGGDALTQYLLYNGGALGRPGHGPGGFFGVMLLIFGFFAVAKIGRMWMWRAHGGPAPWHHHAHDGAPAATPSAPPAQASPAPGPAGDVTQV